MATIKSYTNLEQSKVLAKILPIENADMYWKNGVSDKYIQCFTPFVIDDYKLNVDFDYDVPCWSLAALIEALPKIYNLKPLLDLEENSIIYTGYIDATADNPVDACVAMIEKLHESNLL